jgi:acetylserotonin N-methyltransferase
MPTTDLTAADPTPVIDLLNGFRKSKVMFAAAKLGVFDALHGTTHTAGELAAKLGLDPAATVGLLGACQMLGLLAAEGGRYANTPTADTYLTSASPNRMLGYANYSDTVLWKLWEHLDDAVREGTHRWQQTYGWDGPIFSSFFKTPEAMREFLMGMHGFGLLSSPVVVNAVDLSPFTTLVDLGGATGHLTIAACRRWPNLRGVVFDLPVAIPLADEIVAATEVKTRIATAAGDFFTGDLPRGDLYAVGRILHDWTEAKIHALLARVYDALPSGGGLLIAEKLLHDDKSGPPGAVLQSLNMLVCTEGKERTLAEYADLLNAHGFRNVTGVKTSAPVDAILARKP